MQILHINSCVNVASYCESALTYRYHEKLFMPAVQTCRVLHSWKYWCDHYLVICSLPPFCCNILVKLGGI